MSQSMDRCCKVEGLCCGLRTNFSESSLAYENPSICSGQSLKTMITNHSLIIINQRHQAHRRPRHATSVTEHHHHNKFFSLSVFKSSLSQSSQSLSLTCNRTLSNHTWPDIETVASVPSLSVFHR